MSMSLSITKKEPTTDSFGTTIASIGNSWHRKGQEQDSSQDKKELHVYLGKNCSARR